MRSFASPLRQLTLATALLGACDYSTDLDIPDDDSGDTAADTAQPDTGDTGEQTTDPSVDDDGDGRTEDDGDCNDEDDTIYPGATELPWDGSDQDCDGGDLEDWAWGGAGSAYSCGLTSQGMVLCWGSNADGQSSPATGPFPRGGGAQHLQHLPQ